MKTLNLKRKSCLAATLSIKGAKVNDNVINLLVTFMDDIHRCTNIGSFVDMEVPAGITS